jgi:hypothetical protein
MCTHIHHFFMCMYTCIHTHTQYRIHIREARAEAEMRFSMESGERKLR